MLAAAPQLRAQTLEVMPVRIELPPGQLTTTLSITNRGTEPTAVQARAFAWSQKDNSEQLDATRDLVLSPPIAELPPGETQLMRILLRKPPVDKEATYRILVDQIPPAEDPGTVRIALRLSLPLFAEPMRRVAPEIDWRVVSADGSSAELVAQNRGGRHVRLTKVSLSGPDGLSLTVAGDESPYILPGAERRWKLTGHSAPLKTGTPLRLNAASNGGSFEAAPVIAAQP
jgi:fimbrial chaperone protein